MASNGITAALDILCEYCPGAAFSFPDGSVQLVDLADSDSKASLYQKATSLRGRLCVVIVSGSWTLDDATQIALIARSLSRHPASAEIITCCTSRFFALVGDDEEMLAAECLDKLVTAGCETIYDGLAYPHRNGCPSIAKKELVRREDRLAESIPVGRGNILSPHSFCYKGELPDEVADALLARKTTHLYGKLGKGNWLLELFPEMGWSWFSTTMSDNMRPVFAVRFLERVSGYDGLLSRMFPAPLEELEEKSKLLDALPYTIPDDVVPTTYNDVVEALGIAKDIRDIILGTMREYEVKFRDSSQHLSFDLKVDKARKLLVALGAYERLDAYFSGVPISDILA